MSELLWVLSGSLLILTVIAIRRCFGGRLRPGLRCALWALVLLRLLYPGALWQSPVSLVPAALSQAVRDTSPAPDPGPAAGVPQAPAAPAKMPIPAGDPSPASPARPVRGADLGQILRAVWICGALLAAALMLATNIVLYLRLRRRRVPLAADCPVRVWSVDGLDSSCLFAGSIYVNGRTVTSPQRLRHVLAHELSHRRHLDPLWAALRCAALAVHWYNPLVWYAASLSRQDGELFADAGALKRLGAGERDSYGATLIELSRRPAGLSPLCAATTMAGTKKQLKERVVMISGRPRATLAAALAAALIAALAAGCAFAGSGTDTPDTPDIPAAGDTVTDDIPDTPDIPDIGDAADDAPIIEVQVNLGRLLAGTDPDDVTLTFITDEGPGDPVPGGECVFARRYLDFLASVSWTDAQSEFSRYSYRVRLETPTYTLTVSQGDGRAHLETAAGDSMWFDVSAAQPAGEIYGWEVYDTVSSWYSMSAAALEHRGTGTPLTAEEMETWTLALLGQYSREEDDGSLAGYAAPINGFFLCDWTDPRDLDPEQFMSYFGWPEWLDLPAEPDEKELEAVRRALGDMADMLDWLPVQPIPASVVSEVLTRYTGYTLEDMNRDWREELFYVEEYDSFYSFTSDFGPGSFSPLYGERNSDIITLWSRDHVLKIRETPTGWTLLSHTPTE